MMKRLALSALVLTQTINISPDGKGGFGISVSGWRPAVCRMFCPNTAEVPPTLAEGEMAELTIGGQSPGARQRAIYGYLGWTKPSPAEARRIFAVATRLSNAGWPGHKIGYHMTPACGGAETPVNYVWLTDAEADAQVRDTTCLPWPR